MRLRALELVSYGAFAHRRIEIGPGLTVVHGPNESGKSTLSHALGDLLWGLVPRQHPYAFLVSPSQLRIAATVTRRPGAGDMSGAGDASGAGDMSGAGDATGSGIDAEDALELVVDSRGCRDATGDAVAPWWRDGPITSRAAWTTALGLDLAGLRDGGRGILTDGGDLAGMLFRARTGVDVAQARKALQDHADAIYRRHRGARKVQVRELLAAAERARAATLEATSSAAEVARLREAADRCENASQAADREYQHREAALGAAEEAHRAWEPAAQIHAARRRHGRLRSLGRVLDVADLAAFDEAHEKVTKLTRQLAELDEEITGLDARLDGLVVDDTVLASAPTVDGLRSRRDLERQRVEALAGKRSELDAVRRDIRRALLDLAPGSGTDRNGTDPHGTDPHGTDPHDADHVDDDRDAAHDSGAALRAEATAVLVPVDVADLLGRAAAELSGATRELRAEEQAVADARARRTELPPAPAGGDDVRALDDLRRARDQAWQAVRLPWLAGDVPDAATRARLADTVETSIRSTDTAADTARAHAEDTGRILEADTQLGTRMRRLDALRARHRDQTTAWSALLAGAGIPRIVDPDAWEVRRSALDRLSALLHDEHTRQTSLTADEREAAAYAAQVCEAGRTLGITDGDIWAVLPQVIARVDEAQRSHAAAETLRESRRKATDKRERLARTRAGHEAVIDRLRAEDDLDEVVERSRQVAAEHDNEQRHLDQLRHAVRPGTDLEELLGCLAEVDAAELTARQDAAREARDEALAARDQARATRQTARAALGEASRTGDAAILHAREVEAAEVLAAEVREYVRTRVMIVALERLLAAEEPAHDSTLLAHASDLVTRLTAGRVTRLLVEEDRAGQRRLRIEANGLGDGVPEELSEGTADQVYLALRLAGIRQTQTRAVAAGRWPLPVVLDDVLVTHDDARTASSVEVLAQEAQDQQILLMTHHTAVADAARRVGATVVGLDPLPDPAATPVTGARVRTQRSVTDTVEVGHGIATAPATG